MKAAASAIFFLGLIASACAQTTASGSTTVSAGTTGTVNLSGALGSLINVAGLALFGTQGISVQVSTTSTTAVNVNLAVNIDLGISIANSASLSTNGLSFSGNAIAGLTAPLYFTLNTTGSSAGSTITLSLTPTATFAVSATGNTQLHLFAADGSAASIDGSASANYYGAVAVSQSGNTLSYTLNLPQTGNKLLLGTAQKASFASSSNSASDNSAFSSNSLFPVAFNSAFNYQPGTQYVVGQSLAIAAQAQTSFTVGSASVYNANNQPPAQGATGYGLLAYSYQINSNSNSNGNVVLRWTGSPAFFVQGTKGSINSTAGAANAAWYKSNSAVASGGAWARQSSTSQLANGQLTVTTQANSFSQWTVAASSATATVFSAFLIVAAIVAAMF